MNAPQAMPSQTRRVTSGEVSSGSRVLTLAAVAAAVVVFPARSAREPRRCGLGATGAQARRAQPERRPRRRGRRRDGGVVSSAM